MASNTKRLGLLKKDPVADGNDTFNIKTMLNDNWDAIDAKVAVLGADGKVPAEQLSVATPTDASTTQKGVVQLEDSVTSTSTTKAATANAVKLVKDSIPTLDDTVTSVATDKAATANAVKKVNDDLMTHKSDLVAHGIYGKATGTNSLLMTVENVQNYVEGMLVAFKNTVSNTGASTLNINSLGAKAIKKANGNALSSGNLKAGGIYQLRYDGVNFILLGEGGEYGTATASDVLIGKTIGTENGVVNGTLEKGKNTSTLTGLVVETTSKNFTKYDGSLVLSQYLIINLSLLTFIPSKIEIFVTSSTNLFNPMLWYKNNYYSDGSYYANCYTGRNHTRAPYSISLEIPVEAGMSGLTFKAVCTE